MKKGESALTIVFSMIFLAIVITIFYVLFLSSSIGKAEYDITQINIADMNINLMNYLRTPVDDKNIHDLIVDSYYNDNYDDLEKNTENIFNRVYDKERCPFWEIYGDIEDEKFFDYESEFDVRRYTLSASPHNFFRLFNDDIILTRISSIEIIIPENKKAKITLKEGCINE